jgi:hypothetical protein
MTTTARPLVEGELEAFLNTLTIASGGHASLDDGACVMEAVAYVAGERWSDHPQCASRVISAFLRAWNDAMNDEDRQQLKPLVPRLVGTAASDEVELRRSWMALDWYCRVSAPTWLRLAGLNDIAVAIEATEPIVDSASATRAQGALAQAPSEADAARAAAWAAARDAARAAARDAAWDAAWAAAWAAAGDAARAAGDAETAEQTRIFLALLNGSHMEVPADAKS